MKKTLVYCLACCLAVLLSPSFLHAQISSSTALVGTVLDGTGSAVTGAKVTAIEESTKVSASAMTNGEGYYAITFINPGTYDITVEKTGFKKVVTVGVPVAVDTSARTDFTLSVGSVTEEVTVSASTPPIATDDANLGETFAKRQVDELPMNGRNALEVAALASNVTIGTKTNYSGNPPGIDFNGAGQRETQNSITLDGVSIMNNLGNVTPARPSTDMISEVQMQSGNYPAQYGAYLGVHINLVSKSGTNDLHGSVYEYFKNTDLNARNYIDCTQIARCNPITKKAALNYNQYGFALGGPVYIPKLYNGRNKTFFFGSYEKLNQKAQSVASTTVLSQAMRNGNFSALGSWNPATSTCVAPAGVTSPQCIKDPSTGTYYPGNIIPASELSTASAAIAQKYMAYIPLPNSPGTNGINNNYASVNYPNDLWIAQTLTRVDENVGQHVRLFARYHWQNLTYANGSVVPANSAFGPGNSRNLAFGYSHIITPQLVNDFHFGINTFVTDVLNYWYINNLKGAGTALGIPGFNYDTTTGNLGVPYVSVTSAAGMNIGNNGSNWFQDDRTIDAFNQVSYTRGRHNIMAGVEFRKLTLGRAATNVSLGEFFFQPGGPSGTTTGYGPSDFVLGLANQSLTPVNTVKGSVAQWRDGFFALDNWQVSSKFTLNYGLRYDLPTVPYSLNGYARIMNASQTALLEPSSATTANSFVATPGLKFSNPTHDNWGPRIGFAYRATDKLVIRGGVGFYYNANQLNSFTLLSSNYPLASTVTYNTSTALPITFANPTPGSGSTAPVAGTCTPTCTYVSVVNYNPNNKTQRSYQWNLTAGYELWRGAGAEVQYLGSHSLHLDRSFYNNEPLTPAAGSINSRRPNQLFGSIRTLENDAYAQYNGLTVIFRQRLFHGFSGQASYTWSHTLDLSSDSNAGGTLSQQYNPSADYGNSNWDIRNRLVALLSYELPRFSGSNMFVRQTLGGWQVNNILNLQTGVPINVILNYQSANMSSGIGQERPSFVHAQHQSCTTQNYIKQTSCIDATAYVLPVAPASGYAFGNLARNSLMGPGFNYDNFSIFKNFPIWERVTFQFRAEAFNVTNHPSPANPGTTGGSSTANPSAYSLGPVSTTSTIPSTNGFGLITDVQKLPGQLSGSRVLQLSGKINF
jgi:hypothetical protein